MGSWSGTCRPRNHQSYLSIKTAVISHICDSDYFSPIFETAIFILLEGYRHQITVRVAEKHFVSQLHGEVGAASEGDIIKPNHLDG